jgi:hypothetical protein
VDSVGPFGDKGKLAQHLLREPFFLLLGNWMTPPRVLVPRGLLEDVHGLAGELLARGEALAAEHRAAKARLDRTDHEEAERLRDLERQGLLDREIAEQLCSSESAIVKRRQREGRRKLRPPLS